MAAISKLADHVANHAESIAVEIVERVIERLEADIPVWEKEQAVTMYVDLMYFFGKSLIYRDEGVPQALIEWSKKNGERQVSSGGKISEVIVRYPPTREVFTDILMTISSEFSLSMKEAAFVIKRINAILDVSLSETVFAFERLTDQKMNETKQKMAELSAPVVPIKDGIAVLPFIGEIDHYRATYILEKVVPEIAGLQIEHLIADFSGILTIDTDIARYLYQIENILRLLGVRTIMTGLRPELAQIVINSGIDMTAIPTFANVKQALASIK
jgi:rsbT co-antagonist protein RsbR